MDRTATWIRDRWDLPVPMRANAVIWLTLGVSALLCLAGVRAYVSLFPASDITVRAGVETPAATTAPMNQQAFDPARLLPVCPFRALTGIGCPTCGTGRAVICIAAGQPGRALTLNPLATLVILGSVALTPIAALQPELLSRLTRRIGSALRTRRARILAAALIAAQWIYIAWRGV
jgi:hypothetical protein